MYDFKCKKIFFGYKEFRLIIFVFLLYCLKQEKIKLVHIPNKKLKKLCYIYNDPRITSKNPHLICAIKMLYNALLFLSHLV